MARLLVLKPQCLAGRPERHGGFAQNWSLSFAVDLPPLMATGRWRERGRRRGAHLLSIPGEAAAVPFDDIHVIDWIAATAFGGWSRAKVGA